MKTSLPFALSLISAVSFAQQAPSAAAESGVATQPVPAATSVVDPHSVGIHLGANVGLLSVDVQRDSFYGFAAANVGIPLLSNGDLGAFVLGAGASVALSVPGESMWFLDLYGMALPGWSTNNSYAYGYPKTRDVSVGLGLGAGFRYLHRSGFVFGIKVPIFGVGVGPGAASYNGGTEQMVLAFYRSSVIALPMLSIGYRF